MKPITHFVVTIFNSHEPIKLMGKTRAIPGTFGFYRAVLTVRHSYPYIASIKIDWARHDGTDNPPDTGTIYH